MGNDPAWFKITGLYPGLSGHALKWGQYPVYSQGVFPERAKKYLRLGPSNKTLPAKIQEPSRGWIKASGPGRCQPLRSRRRWGSRDVRSLVLRLAPCLGLLQKKQAKGNSFCFEGGGSKGVPDFEQPVLGCIRC